MKPRRGSLLYKKTLALTVLLACGVHGAFAATFTWTGADGDYKWSNTNNWLKDSAATDTLPAAGDTVQLYPRRGETTDAHAIEVDVADVSVAKIVSGDADNAATTVTLTGESITLTSDYPLDAYAPTVVSNAVTFARSGNMTVRCGKHIYLSGAVTLDCTMFLFKRGIGAKSGDLYVYGTVDGPNTTLGSDGDNMTCYLYNRIRLKALESGRSSCCGNILLSGKGNDCPLGKVYYYGRLTADAAYAFPSNMVMTWNGDRTDSGNWEKFTFSTAQLVDRVSRPSPTCDASGVIIARSDVSGSSGATLTLRATASAVAYARFLGNFNLVWDPVGDYTQSVGGMTHSISGKLTVKGGTFSSVGTNTFAKLSALIVHSNATFKVASGEYGDAVNPFPNGVRAEIGLGGAIEVPAGVTVTFGNTLAYGVLLPVGTYQSRTDGTDATAKKVDWVKGGGIVSVTVANGTSWASPVSGDWSDASKWSNGFPDGTGPVYLAVEGAPYAVAISGTDDWLTNLVVRGPNTTLNIAADETVWYDGTGRKSSIAIESGGTLSVAGKLVLTNYPGTFTIASSDTSVTSRFVVSGTADYVPSTAADYRINLKTGGAVEISGGKLTLLRGYSSSPFSQNGGTLRATGNGILALGGKDGTQEVNTPFETGTVLFENDSCLTNGIGKFSYQNWGPWNAGGSLYVAFRDRAAMRCSIFGYLVIGKSDVHTVLDLDSDATHRSFGYRTRVRATGTGTAEMRVQKGKVLIGARGLDVADDDKTSAVAHGTYVQTGGWLYNESSNGSWTDQGKPNGFTVGYGANATVSSGTVAYGEAYQSGGTNQNAGSGVTLVGVGYGKGSYVQTGGYYWHDSSGAAFGVGAAGGEGLWAVSNGELRVKADAYVGGFHTNILVKAEKMTRWPDARHDATGTLVAAGGTLAFQRNLVLGADGRGTLEIVGPDPKLTVGGNLILSNHVANAASGGTLVYRLANGCVAPAAVTGNLVIRSGAKLVVDVGDTLPERRQRLVTAASVIGAFDPEDITLVGKNTKKVCVTVGANGIDLKTLSGLTLILK